MKKHPLLSAGIILFGNFLYALTVKLFLLPAGLITGGTTGIALFLNRLSGTPVAVTVFVFNTAMLVTGLCVLGKRFALTTILSTFAYPAALHLLDIVLKDIVLTDDPVLCTVFSGLGIGISLALVIREGASTGGMDIPPLILHKLFHWNVSLTLYTADCLILLLQAFSTPAQKILYGILLVLIYSLTLEHCILLGTSKTEVRIISRRSDEIRRMILSDLDRGVTVVHAEGGYSSIPEALLMTVITNRELPALENRIRAVDPEAFMIVTRVSEVRGRGFTLNKKYG